VRPTGGSRPFGRRGGRCVPVATGRWPYGEKTRINPGSLSQALLRWAWNGTRIKPRSIRF